MRFLLHFYVCASPEALGKKYWGSGCKAHCHWNLSDSSLSLSVSHSLTLCLQPVYIYIYITLSISEQFVTATQTLRRAEIYLQLSLLSCDLFLCNFTGYTHTHTHINSCEAARKHIQQKPPHANTHAVVTAANSFTVPQTAYRWSPAAPFYPNFLMLPVNIVGFAHQPTYRA